MQPNTQLNLCNIPYLDRQCDHTLTFNSLETQENFFRNNTFKVVNKCQYLRQDNAIKVEGYIEDFEQFNYLFYINKRKVYYCFIVGKEYVNERTTKLYIETDLIQTYLFDFIIKASFVERMHVNRWLPNGKPTKEIEPENLETGEYEIVERQKIHQYKDNYIIVTTTPLGNLSGGSVAPPVDPSEELWKTGKLDSKGFRFCKGFEGFAPYEYKDANGYLTIAYGVTKHGEPAIYNELASSQPVSEEKGAKISYDTLNNRYGSVIKESAIRDFKVDKQCEFNALLDLAYNCGNGVITDSADKRELKKAFITYGKDESKIRPIWENYFVEKPSSPNHQGLKARRKQECNMFFGKAYEVRAIGKLNNKGQIVGTVTENSGNGWLP